MTIVVSMFMLSGALAGDDLPEGSHTTASAKSPLHETPIRSLFDGIETPKEEGLLPVSSTPAALHLDPVASPPPAATPTEPLVNLSETTQEVPNTLGSPPSEKSLTEPQPKADKPASTQVSGKPSPSSSTSEIGDPDTLNPEHSTAPAIPFIPPVADEILGSNAVPNTEPLSVGSPQAEVLKLDRSTTPEKESTTVFVPPATSSLDETPTAVADKPDQESERQSPQSATLGAGNLADTSTPNNGQEGTTSTELFQPKDSPKSNQASRGSSPSPEEEVSTKKTPPPAQVGNTTEAQASGSNPPKTKVRCGCW